MFHTHGTTLMYLQKVLVPSSLVRRVVGYTNTRQCCVFITLITLDLAKQFPSAQAFFSVSELTRLFSPIHRDGGCRDEQNP